MVGLTISSDCAWSGRFWIKTAPKTYKREWCESVRVIGDGLKITRLPTKENEHKVRPELERTVSAWGLEKQSQLENLIVGIIGTGSVGAIIGEALTRTGLKCLILLDFDSVEKANLDRLLHATRQDADLKRAKVQVMAKAYEKSSTAERFKVEPLEYSIVEEDGFKAALDCDILFSCVDRPWPRHVLNFIAYAHLIPVVDGGIAAEANTKMTGLRRADWKAHVVGPGRRCLACLGQYDPGLVSAERDGYLDDPSYIAGLPHDHSARRNENVFIFSLATAALELIHFLYLTIEPAGLSKVGAQTFHLVPSMLVTGKKKAKCAPECLFPSWEALGDRSGLTFTGRHIRAERVRAERRR
jgi:hypothetical protein